MKPSGPRQAARRLGTADAPEAVLQMQSLAVQPWGLAPVVAPAPGGASLALEHRDKSHWQRTLSVEELPAWAHRYPFIQRGYRDPNLHASLYDVALSLFSWHSETINIHLHLLPALCCFLMVLVRIPGGDALSAGPGEWVIHGACLLCGCMFLFSASAHAVHVMSPSAMAFAWRLDFTGIILGAFGRFLLDAWVLVAVLHSDHRAFLLSAGLAFACILLGIWRTWLGELRWAYFFGLLAPVLVSPALAYCAFAPSSTAQLAIRGVDLGALRTLVAWLIASTCILLGGIAVFYVGRLPERFLRLNLLDFAGNSHNFFHITCALSFWAGALASSYLARIEASLTPIRSLELHRLD